MQRAKYAVTFLCVVLAVASAFFWYRSTTTATDACIVYLTPTREFLMVTDDGALYLYLERRNPPVQPNQWAQTSWINGDSRFRIGENLWSPPRFKATPVGIGWGHDQRRVFTVDLWQSGLRLALPLIAGLFLVVPVARVFRALRRSRRATEPATAKSAS